MANGSFLGQKVKITVVRTLKFDDLAQKYGQIRPGGSLFFLKLFGHAPEQKG